MLFIKILFAPIRSIAHGFIYEIMRNLNQLNTPPYRFKLLRP